MKIRTATHADLSFIAAANAALATETEGKSLDHTLLHPGVQAVLDDPSLGRYYVAEIDDQAVGQLMTTFEQPCQPTLATVLVRQREVRGLVRTLQHGCAISRDSGPR